MSLLVQSAITLLVVFPVVTGVWLVILRAAWGYDN